MCPNKLLIQFKSQLALIAEYLTIVKYNLL